MDIHNALIDVEMDILRGQISRTDCGQCDQEKTI
jgi:hypothetical protein